MEGVSVVVPCYNSAAHLRECIDSIAAQEYPGPLEVLVADDGSRDDSRDIARSYWPFVRTLRHADGGNHGVPVTRNLCLRNATQPLIAFLDSDDIWLPGHLVSMVTALTEHPEAGLAYNNGAYLLADGSIVGARFPEGHQAVTAEELLLACELAVNGVLVRRTILDTVGLFEESLRYTEDHDLWLRVLEHAPGIYVPHCGWLYRRHGTQMSRSGEMWRYAQQTLDRARARGRYPEHLLRKRQAVIDYRLGRAALAQRRLLRAGWHFTRAAWLDPARSLRQLTGWFK